MDTIDVGGASAGGRPEMPAIVTVDESGAELQGTGYTSDAPVPEKKTATPNEKVQRAVSSTPLGHASAAYPDTHPANREDVELDPSGGLILPKGHNIPVAMPLGDIRQGYVTGPRNAPVNNGAGTTPPAAIDESMAELTAKLELMSAPTPAESLLSAPVAHNEVGAPLIEILYHLDIGVVVSYHSKVVEQGRFLIFIDDNTLPAKQKFIPKPGDDTNVLDVTITGSDKIEQPRRIRPLGINFTVDNYDFFVMLLAPTEE